MAAFVVSNTADSGGGSLRQAILDANASGQASTIAFAGIAANSSINLLSALPALAVSLTIDGTASAGLEINGQGSVQILTAGAGSPVSITIRSLSLVNGLAKGGDAGIRGGGGLGAGGALFIDASANVNLVDVYFTGNEARGGAGGGAISGSASGAGGGLNGGTGGAAGDAGTGGAGAFGEGGGGSDFRGGAGGFGGGGGRGYGGNGAGGFAAGSGGGSSTIGGGGGGAGLGGAVFIREGGTLTISGGSFASNTAVGGSGGTAGGETGPGGQGIGSGLFLGGGVNYAVAAGETISITDNFGGGAPSGARGGLTKSGVGTLALAGSNTYTGTTQVAAGTLLIDGSVASSAANVQAGATLGGSGTTGSVSVAADGVLSAGGGAGGSNIGSLVTGNLSLGTSARLRADVNLSGSGVLTYDQIRASGTVSLDYAILDIYSNGAFTSSPGEKLYVLTNDLSDAIIGDDKFYSFSVNGSAASPINADDTFVAFGRLYQVDYQANGDAGLVGNDIALVDVTPPPTYKIVSSADVAEGTGTGNGGQIVFTVSRSDDASQAGSVVLAFSGTAAQTGPGTDYVIESGTGTYDALANTLSFAAGQSSATLIIKALPDAEIEASETVTATLTGVASGGGALSSFPSERSASATILNDDLPPPSDPAPGEPNPINPAPKIEVGGASADSLVGGSFGDSLFGAAGNDTLVGLGGSDLIYGNQGDDLIYGNQDADTLYGGQGDDRAFGGQGNDVLYGNLGNDVLFGNLGADIVYGNQGNDIVYGNQGADVLFGGQGNDVLYGGQDADTLVGGVGDDTLVGGLGADLYRFDPNSGRDLIVGFDQADGDRIALGGQTYTVSSGQSGDALLTLSGGGVMDLGGIRPDQVNASYFAA